MLALYDLNELCLRAKVTPRTVRYYIQQGLLPSPGTLGPATRYNQGHLDRLRLIRNLQREHQPLAEIRAQMEGLTDRQVRRLLEASAPMVSPSSPSSAAEYVRSVLGRSAPSRERSVFMKPIAPQAVDGSGLEEETDPAGVGAAASRSQWERIVLAPDVELHLRRPLTRETNRRVEKLLDLARQILQEEE